MSSPSLGSLHHIIMCTGVCNKNDPSVEVKVSREMVESVRKICSLDLNNSNEGRKDTQ
jgi:hypothetical protein